MSILFFYAKPCHSTTPPLGAHLLPQQPLPQVLPHQDPLSQTPPPTRVRAGAGPTGGLGAVGPPVWWASGQHGDGGGSEETAACPGPAGPANQRRGGQAGQAARWVTTAAAAAGGRGEEGTRVSSGHAGEGESRWAGEGQVNPHPASPAPQSHPPLGTPASRPPPCGPAPASEAQSAGWD